MEKDLYMIIINYKKMIRYNFEIYDYNLSLEEAIKLIHDINISYDVDLVSEDYELYSDDRKECIRLYRQRDMKNIEY